MADAADGARDPAVRTIVVLAVALAFPAAVLTSGACVSGVGDQDHPPIAGIGYVPPGPPLGGAGLGASPSPSFGAPSASAGATSTAFAAPVMDAPRTPVSASGRAFPAGSAAQVGLTPGFGTAVILGGPTTTPGVGGARPPEPGSGAAPLVPGAGSPTMFDGGGGGGVIVFF